MLRKIWNKLFSCCHHHWVDKTTLCVKDDDDIKVAIIYVLQCKHCGDITQRKVQN